jgi:membrane fusion protein, multidrug efflux system
MSRFQNTLAFVLSFLSFVSIGCTDKAAPPPGNTAIPVMAAKAVRKSVPVELHAIGSGEAHATVSVESQVAGIVREVHYQQGEYVNKGKLLVSIDDRPFQASLQLAQANLSKDQANAELAKIQEERYAKLYKAGVVPKGQYDQYVATARADEAAVEADNATIATANLQVSYCSIYAPIGGRTGSQLVYPGTVVKANDVPVLVVINEISPIYVTFSVPQQYLDQIKSYMVHGKLPIQVVPTDGAAESGYLTFVNNTVDAKTGTIELKGSFENKDRKLWPGEFVNVILKLTEEKDAVVVPSQAVLTGQQGDYLFVVNPDMTVESRAVKVDRTVNDESVVAEGVEPGETVVTDGQVRLVPGVKVAIKSSL